MKWCKLYLKELEEYCRFSTVFSTHFVNHASVEVFLRRCTVASLLVLSKTHKWKSDRAREKDWRVIFIKDDLHNTWSGFVRKTMSLKFYTRYTATVNGLGMKSKRSLTLTQKEWRAPLSSGEFAALFFAILSLDARKIFALMTCRHQNIQTCRVRNAPCDKVLPEDFISAVGK